MYFEKWGISEILGNPTMREFTCHLVIIIIIIIIIIIKIAL